MVASEDDVDHHEELDHQVSILRKRDPTQQELDLQCETQLIHRELGQRRLLGQVLTANDDALGNLCENVPNSEKSRRM